MSFRSFMESFPPRRLLNRERQVRPQPPAVPADADPASPPPEPPAPPEPQPQIPPARTSPLPPTNSLRHQQADKRLTWGWDRESIVKNTLQQVLGGFTPSDSTADRIRKVDGYLNGREVQIKARETKNDIPVEMWKNLDVARGRDMRTIAKLYAVLDSSATVIYLIDASLVKKAAQQLEDEWRQSGLEWYDRGTYRGTVGELKFHWGDRPHDRKVMAFIRPEYFQGQAQKIAVPQELKKSA